MRPLERTYLDCSCDDPNHVIRYTYDPDDGMLCVEMRLVDYLSWYKRMWVGIKYILGILKSQHYAYDCSIIKPTDYDKLLEVVNKAKSFQIKL